MTTVSGKESPAECQFTLRWLVYAIVLVESALAAFGPMGLPVAMLPLLSWDFRRDPIREWAVQVRLDTCAHRQRQASVALAILACISGRPV